MVVLSFMVFKYVKIYSGVVPSPAIGGREFSLSRLSLPRKIGEGLGRGAYIRS